MGKVIKLNLKDIENILLKTLNESEMESTNDVSEESNDERNTMVIGKGEDGKIYAVDSKTGEILGIK
jgi:hypothetical protein